ncbi:MAG: hypothetical protein JWQ14_598 [Adhaeribacter sp.]|nr:hypothetical protein [Adhaeribacter sp.]
MSQVQHLISKATFVLVGILLWYGVPISNLVAQPTKQWDKTIGGSGYDELKSVQQTTDGGYILGGNSQSKASGDKSEDSRSSYYGDFWIVKLNATGGKEWDKTLGTIEVNNFTAVCQTADGGYIVGGQSLAKAGRDKTQDSKGINDYWIIKLDARGNKIWDKTIGGPWDDLLWTLKPTKDGGVILGGESQGGPGGDKTQAPKGGYDFWVVKLDAQGNKQWDKTIGGSGYDILRSMDLTFDGGYILGGLSASEASGDKSENSKAAGSTESLAGYDYWVVKLDAQGSKQWDKTLGGNALDDFRHVIQTKDGGYIVGGESFSNIGGDKSENSKGGRDFWLVKLNASGNKEWDKTMGGPGDEYLRALHQNTDGGFVLSGSNKSLLKLNTSGNIEWEKSVNGGSSFLTLDQTADGGFILGNSSNSQANGDKSEDSKGGYDYWVVKLWFPPVPPPTISTTNLSTSAFCAGSSLPIYFTTTGTFAPGEVFQVQLSSASGSFVSPVIIGSGTSSPIVATIPANSIVSAKYRIRVVSSSTPVIIGTESRGDIAISNTNSSPPIKIEGTYSACQGGTGYFIVSSTNGYTDFSWSVPSGWTITSGQGTNYITVAFGESGGTVSVTSKNPCGLDISSHLPVQIVVKPFPPIVYAATICGPGTVTLVASGAPSTGSYRWYNSDSGFTLISSNTIFTTPLLTASTTYFVSVVNGNCESARVPVTVTVNPLPKVLVTANTTTVTSGGAATLTASGAIAYTWSPATGLSSTTGATVVAKPTATTTYTATGTDANGCTSATAITITVNTSGLKMQTITFPPIPNKIYGDAPFTLNATSSSGLQVSYRIVSGPAMVSGKTLTITGVGTVSVRAYHPGNDQYLAATPVEVSFNVLSSSVKLSQSLNFAALPTKTYGDAPVVLSGTATSGLPVSYSILSGSATLSGNTITLTGTGPVTVRAHQAGNETYAAAIPVDQTFTVNKASQTIAFTALADKTYGDGPIYLIGKACSGLPVSFRVTLGPASISGNILTINGAGTVTVLAEQGGNSNYLAAMPVPSSFVVIKANQTITMAIIPNKTYGDAPSALSATASSGLAIIYSIVSGPATVVGNSVTLTGVGTVTIKASQPGNANYNPSATERSFSVNSATPVPTACTVAVTSKVRQAEPWYGMWGPVTGSGAIDVTVSGGAAPYSYQWNTGEKTEDLTVAAPGTFTVTVTDAQGCKAVSTVYVGRKNGPMTLYTSVMNVSAAGSQDGSVNLSVTGGVEPFKYRWSNGAITEDITGLAAGSYTVVVTDAFGTAATVSVQIQAAGIKAQANTRSINNSEVFSFKETGLIVYPNPATGKTNLAISLAMPGKYTLELYDIRGAKVKTLATGQAGDNEYFTLQVDVASYAEGVYLLKLITGEEVLTKRISIKR